MHANKIMITDVITCGPEQTIEEVAKILDEKTYRMIPVVDENNKILGAINTLSLLSSLVPAYIVKGYLKSIPYAPDIGLLRKHYKEILAHKVKDVMDEKPTIVHANESLLSVTAALITHDRFEYAMVADKDDCLVGIVSSSDVLKCLNNLDEEAYKDV
ncbi:MAG: CBS domain-containing protein [Mariprofundaceae bacterium]